MMFRITKFTEFGIKRRVHHHCGKGEHITYRVLWRKRKGHDAVEVFSGRRGPRCYRTIALRTAKPCPAPNQAQCVLHCGNWWE